MQGCTGELETTLMDVVLGGGHQLNGVGYGKGGKELLLSEMPQDCVGQ